MTAATNPAGRTNMWERPSILCMQDALLALLFHRMWSRAWSLRVARLLYPAFDHHSVDEHVAFDVSFDEIAKECDEHVSFVELLRNVK